MRTRPTSRGYIHQFAFFIAISACVFLLMNSNGPRAYFASFIYCISLISMFGVSALYHVPTWSRPKYLILRRIDHATIFVLIAGTATPICLLSLVEPASMHLLLLFWIFALIGIILANLWTHGPKWLRALLYIAIGWLGILYAPDIIEALYPRDLILLLSGGLIYTLGAIIYALKWPNPFPKHFGYHEIFHIMVVIASACHFLVIYDIAT